MSTPAPAVVTYAWDAPGARPWLRQYLHDGAAAVKDAAARAGLDTTIVNALQAPDAAAVAARASGVIVMGGADVDPALYGQDPRTDTLSQVYPHADTFEADLMRAALELGRPVLGVCRGMQLLNVALGGTLIQDLGPASGHTLPVDGASATDHNVEVADGSLAHRVWGTRVLPVRSDHHQAIDHLGGNLSVSALAGDGVIEAVEGMDSWCLGVQWHPEDPGAPAGQLDALIAAFAAAAR